MHSKAEAWDKAHGYVTKFGALDQKEPKGLPRNRPCDWCGQPVDVGYIHAPCYLAERRKWLEIIMD